MDAHDDRLDAAEGPDGAIRTSPGRTRLYFILGGLLAALGLIGVGIYAFTPRPTLAEGEDGSADGALQAGLIIGSGLAVGVGVLLLLWGVVASMRARREG
jgi:hypothetical protein